jgi:hypothetical protein
MMRQDETIDLAELRKLSDTLFRRLEQGGVRQILVKNPYYWMIFPDAAFNSDQQPELLMGHVFDDMSDLRSEAGAPDEEFVSFWHAFHHLSGLMLFLANADLQGGLFAASAEGDVR